MIEKIRRLFEKMDRIYVADGHHRAAAAVKIAQKRRKENPDYTGKESFNYFLSVLFPWDELRIVEYNRVVKDLGGKTVEDFLKEVEKCFQVEKEGSCPVKPEKKGIFGLYVGNTWYRLAIKEEYKSQDPVKNLDVSLLQDGIRGVQELEEAADLEGGAAFTLYPTDMMELIQVADAGRLMPPKSTWFEPKLRSGLFIHRI